MKDLLNFYYYLLPDKIYMKDNNYYFNYNNHSFCFYLYRNNIEDINMIYNLNNYMILNDYKINRIVLNINSNILTKKDNKYYILLELNINSYNKVNIEDIIEFNKYNLNININLLNRTNWNILWSNKVDNIEYTLEHIKKKYKLLYNSCFYYIGLTENAISYLKYININNKNIGICHKRINKDCNLIELYNPVNLIIDYKIRDIAEYYKTLFFYNNIDIKDIINSIKLINMNNVDLIYFYIRMLYPSYFFDMYDSIINNINKEDDLLLITRLQDDYEYLLYEIYLIVKKSTNVIGIDWINKKFAN